MTVVAAPQSVSDQQSNGVGPKSGGLSGDSVASTRIIDIRSERAEPISLIDEIKKGLRPANGKEKKLPTLLLYDEAGLKLFEDITYLEEYYLTNAEIEVLEKYADEIAQRIENGSMVVELGSGNLRKVNILLRALERQGKDIEYYALDLSLKELERTLEQIPTNTYRHVKFAGLHGTYDDGLEWLKSPELKSKPKTILWIGSSIGNFNRHAGADFLRGYADNLRPGENMIIGIDSCNDPQKIYHAYNDRLDVTHSFILNGLRNANSILGKNVFNLDDWEVIGEYVFDQGSGRHQAFLSPRKDVVVDGVAIKSGERIRVEESHKYSAKDIERLWEFAGLSFGSKWATAEGDYALHMVSKPTMFYPLQPAAYATGPVPTVDEWKQIWAAWDTVTRMVPEQDLLSKPIKLRNAVIFYLGHIPTFLDMHLTRATGGQPTEPSHYPTIFERGIDPDVDNPEQCHAHSETPESWPAVSEILQFQARVRQRVQDIMASPKLSKDPKVQRALWLGYEHEIMHLETLLYMLVQSERLLPPGGVVAPDFAALAQQAKQAAVPNDWFEIPGTDVVLGLDDPETEDGGVRFFGWDNEKPPRKAHVPAFSAKARPITNGEYAEYLAETGTTKVPASWIESSTTNGAHVTNGANGTNGTNGHTNGHTTSEAALSIINGKYVRTVFGPVPLKYALDWPIFASYEELLGCANWMGGRIPTLEEARSLYGYVERLKAKDDQSKLSKTIPAVNGHLVNDGVEESPPSTGLSNGSSTTTGPDPHELFVNLEGANVGFKFWHPVSVTQRGDKLCGQGDMGGVWEWTSSVLDKHDGFEAMSLYPGYTADFFDGKHNIVLGGSWATHPRIAGRKTFVNWYQRNYPYVWAGARLVRDL